MIIYQYEMILSLVNREIQLKEIEEEIDFGVKEFNIRSVSARNIKNIVKYEIKENNLLYICLSSYNKMNFPLRGLFLFSKLIIEKLKNESSENSEIKKIYDNIIVGNCLFKIISSNETKNLKLEKSDKVEETKEEKNSFDIVTNDFSGNKELRKKLMTMIRFGLNCLEDLDNDRISQKNRDLINKFDDLKGGDE